MSSELTYNQAVQFKFGEESGPDEFDYQARGDARANLKQYPEALADYEQAIRLNPSFADAYRSRGKLYRETGNPSADEDLQQAARLIEQRAKTPSAERNANRASISRIGITTRDTLGEDILLLAARALRGSCNPPGGRPTRRSAHRRCATRASRGA